MRAVDFLSGIALATFAGSGVYFLKLWKASRDRFFLLFCAACFCLALERFAIFMIIVPQGAGGGPVTEASSLIYLLRLTAFVLILLAVIDRNRRGSARR